MSNRKARISSDIHHIINLNLKEILSFHPDLLSAMLSITKVSMSNDLKIANCYVVQSSQSSLAMESIIGALRKMSYMFRQLINQKLRLKYSPEIKFFYDYELEKSETINQILTSIIQQKSK